MSTPEHDHRLVVRIPSQRSAAAAGRPQNICVESEALVHPDDLWWPMVVLAARHVVDDDGGGSLDLHDNCVCLVGVDNYVQLQRFRGGRAVLWGRVGDHEGPALDEVPDWALTDRLARSVRTQGVNYVAWFAHGEWDAVTSAARGAPELLLSRMPSLEPEVVEAARRNDFDSEALRDFLGADPHQVVELLRSAGSTPAPVGGTVGGTVGDRLLRQIHEQMRDAAEADRMLIQRPAVLVQWSRVNGPPPPFEYAVMAARNQLVPAPTNSRFTTAATRSLTNVLHKLRHDESNDQYGAWLFARVWHDGRMLHFDRAYDSWPAWYQVRQPGQGPSMADLAWEMDQRARQWRPLWASLLPRRGGGRDAD